MKKGADVTGRNDPCPCGSGRKYKKCHGAAEILTLPPPHLARVTALKACDVELGQRVMRFARKRYGATWLRDEIESMGLVEPETELSEAEIPIVIPLALFFWPGDDGTTIAAEWAVREARHVSPDERWLLDAYAESWVSVWEVLEVDPGTGSRLKDLLTGEERFVYDAASTATLERLDAVLAIVVTCDGVSFFGGVYGQPLPPRFAELVTRGAKRMCRVRTRPVAVAKLRDPDLQLDLLGLWNLAVDGMLDRPLPQLSNTDGDPLVLTRDDFALLEKPAEVAKRLAAVPGAEGPEKEGADLVFVVTKADNRTHATWDNTIIGRIVLSQARLVLETNSTRRADDLRAAVEATLGGAIRFRLRKEENTANLIADAASSPPGAGPRVQQVLSDDDAVAVREFRERYLADWLDMSIPALGGSTPREAARSSRARGSLDVLLKEMEQSEARLPENQRIDLRDLRAELGLE